MVIISENRPVEGFDAVNMQCAGDLVIVQGDKESLVVKGEESVLPKLQTYVDGNALMIGFNWADILFTPRQNIIANVTVKELSSISISGSSALEVWPLQTRELRVVISGSAHGEIEKLTAEKFTLTISGNSRLVVTGEVQKMENHVSGSSKLDAERLACRDAEIRISGSGDVVLNASDHLNISISGSGSIRYHGNPHVSQRISGSGHVEQIV